MPANSESPLAGEPEILAHVIATVQSIKNKYHGDFNIKNNDRDRTYGRIVFLKNERFYLMEMVAGWSSGDALGARIYLKPPVLEGILSAIVSDVASSGTVEEADALSAMLLNLRDELIAARQSKAPPEK
jgi:hypothetical protein